MPTLEEGLLAAHASGDVPALIGLYAEAAMQADADGDATRAGFYLTHAYVFALQIGDPRADEFNLRLSETGRDVRITGL